MKTIEPPALMSRIITFVFAGALATTIVLAVTLANLMPLHRTQVFFLTTQLRENTVVRLESFSVSESNIGIYKENFIKEYIRMRNEIVPAISAMHTRWGRGPGGLVNLWSSNAVFADFMDTSMWIAIMNADEDTGWRCRVEFTRPIQPYRIAAQNDERQLSEHRVSFRYFCADNTGQTDPEDYTIVIGIEFQPAIRWFDRLENPLGLIVSEYRVEAGRRDPLDQFDFLIRR
ncbi:MAG: hypothetical protein FWE17_02355 [Alphaproteobacteria bacterium]|nr:hypothetical protein [Alphaproteobacteria bacterium]MCL2758253.1 hypothetical protein [Alphaproteobacteria bacterium]